MVYSYYPPLRLEINGFAAELSSYSEERANMKYCPYCGATIFGGAVSFCMECGKKLPSSASHAEQVPEVSDRHIAGRRQKVNRKKHQPAVPRPNRLMSQPGQPDSEEKQPLPRRQTKKHPEPTHPPSADPRDDGYDGYYDDVLPVDDGQTRKRRDSHLIKRAVILSIVALLFVALSVIVMSVL